MNEFPDTPSFSRVPWSEEFEATCEFLPVPSDKEYHRGEKGNFLSIIDVNLTNDLIEIAPTIFTDVAIPGKRPELERVQINDKFLKRSIPREAGIGSITLRSSEVAPPEPSSALARFSHYMVASTMTKTTDNDVCTGYLEDRGGINHLILDVHTARTAEGVLRWCKADEEQDCESKHTPFERYVGLIDDGVKKAIYKTVKPLLPEMPRTWKALPYATTGLFQVAGNVLFHGPNIQTDSIVGMTAITLAWGSVGLLYFSDLFPRGQFRKAIYKDTIIKID